MQTLVTGATGFIGGALAAALVERGDDVRALVRDPGCARCLREHGVELLAGDLNDAESLRRAVDGVERVFHAAALVGDWLDRREAQRVNVEGTRELLQACAAGGVRRVIAISSLAVLGIRHHYGTDETAPLLYSGDAYGDSKVDAERVVRDFAERGAFETVILRPGFVYGPGDRQFMPRLLESLVRRQFLYIGDGSKLLNRLYIEDMVQAALLADETPAAVGQIYNLTDGAESTLREFVTFTCDYLGIPAPRRHVPVPVAWLACHLAEGLAKLRRARRAPRLNRARLRFIYYNQHYSIEKARRELGYQPRFTYREGLPPTLDWFRESGLAKIGSDAGNKGSPAAGRT